MAAALRAGDVVGGRYEIEAIGASGGMGTVYRARDRETGARVAVKQIASADVRLAREINALAELDHPAVVKYIAHRHDGDATFVVMEWLAGIDLGARLKQGALRVGDAVALLECLAAGLAAMHARGIVHRDIKPRNIMLVDGDPRRAVIVDFGIARRQEDTAVTLGAIVGTPRYMAPEQATGAGVGPRADVYSLGCVVFECVTGHAPFVGPDAISLMAAKVMANPPRARATTTEVPRELDDLLDRMLARDPAARPADGAALIAAVAAIEEAVALFGADAGARASDPATVAVTRHETRISPVILAKSASRSASGETVEIIGEADVEPFLGGLVAARAASLPDGTLIIAVDEPVELVDRVAMAGRAALALARRYPSLHVALATGALTATTAGCEVIDRAAALLVRDSGRVWLDEVSAELLARTHHIERDAIDATASHDSATSAGGPRGREVVAARTASREIAAPSQSREMAATSAPASREMAARESAATIATGAPWLGAEQADATTTGVRDRPAPFVGRERERRALAAIAAECLAERAASTAIVVAEAGLGKSRLVRETIATITGDVVAWSVRADPMAAGAPYALLAQLARSLAGLGEDVGADDDAERRHRIACAVALHVTDAAKIDQIVLAIGAMLDEPWARGPAPALATARQDLVRRGWEDWTAAIAASRPLVIAIDDLHLADATSLAVVDGVLRAARALPVLVVATARPEVATAHPRLWESRGVQTIALAPLADKAADAYLRQVVPGASDAARARIVEHAGGSPFMLEELARAAAVSPEGGAPVAAVAIVQARLDRLAPELRRVLRAASVFGRDFARDGVAAVLAPIDARELAAGLRALAAAEVIDIVRVEEPAARPPTAPPTPRASTAPTSSGSPPTPSGPMPGAPSRPARAPTMPPPSFGGIAHAQFHHDLVRDAAYAALPDRDRALAHRRAAAWLAQRDGIAPAIVAGHYAAAGAHAEATAWWARATARAHAAWDMTAVLRFGALATPGLRGEELGALEELRATAFRWHGQLEEAVASAAIAVRDLPPRDPRWFAALSTQLCMQSIVGHTDGMAALVAQLGDAALADGGDHAALAVGRLLAQLMLNDSAFDRAQTAALERVFAGVVARAGDTPERSDELAIVIADIAGERALEASDHATALHLGEEVYAREVRRGNTVPAQQQLAINGYYMYELGQIAEARAALETALAFAREHEVARLEAHAHHNLGVVVAQANDLDLAVAHERRALDYYARQQDTRMHAGCRMYLAHILIARGELAEAEGEVREALVILAASKYAPFAWATLTRTLLGQRRIDEAAEAIAHATRETRMSEGWAWIAVSEAEIAVALGERERAAAVVRAASAEVARRVSAPAFADARWREAYLTGVEAHRRLAALQRALDR